MDDPHRLLKNENNPFDIASEADFTRVALATFQYQYQANPVYRKWVDLLGTAPGSVTSLDLIPFLPIQVFREQAVVCGDNIAEKVFRSSTTTSQRPSLHYVKSLSVYEESFTRAFELFYGP